MKNLVRSIAIILFFLIRLQKVFSGSADTLHRDYLAQYGAAVYTNFDYYKPENVTKRYPVIYFMGGTGYTVKPDSVYYSLSTYINKTGTANSIDSLIKRGDIPDMIFVDISNKSPQQLEGNTTLYIDLVNYVDANYRTIPNKYHRFLSGHSAGCESSMYVFFGHSNTFHSEICISHPIIFNGYQDNALVEWKQLYSNYLTIKSNGANIFMVVSTGESANNFQGLKFTHDIYNYGFGFKQNENLLFTESLGCGHNPYCNFLVSGKQIFDSLLKRNKLDSLGLNYPTPVKGGTPLSDTLRINFRSSSSPVVAGYLSDTGAYFKKQEGGYYYGWDFNAYQFGFSEDLGAISPLYRSFYKRPYGYFICSSSDLWGWRITSEYAMDAKESNWEIALPNGKYFVRLYGGERNAYSFVNTISSQNYYKIGYEYHEWRVEGKKFVDMRSDMTNQYYTMSGIVEVVDGRLSVTSGKHSAFSSLAAIDIMSVSPTISIPNEAPDFSIGLVNNAILRPTSNFDFLANRSYKHDQWIYRIEKGGNWENTQNLTFEIRNIDSTLYQQVPKINYTPDEYFAGLEYIVKTPAPAPFIDTVIIVLKDNGGTANGGKECYARKAYIQYRMTDTLYLNDYYDCSDLREVTGQTIILTPTTDKLKTESPFNLIATASSGLPVSFSIVSGPATLSGNTVTLTGVEGTVILKASQTGNVKYKAAMDVLDTFIVKENSVFTKANIIPTTITLLQNDSLQLVAQLVDQYGSLMAVTPSSISWSLDSVKAGIINTSGKYFSSANFGSFKVFVSVTYGGITHFDTSYINIINPICSTVIFNQEINGKVWFSLGTHSFVKGTANSIKFEVTATTEGYVIVDGIKLSKAGEADIYVDNLDLSYVNWIGTWTNSTGTAGFYGTNYQTNNVPGSSFTFTPDVTVGGNWQVFVWYTTNTNRANNVTAQICNIGGKATKNDQVITFNTLSDKLTTDSPYNIAATANSGLPVSFSIVSGPATISGNTITLTGSSGLVTVKAFQVGNIIYNAAPDVIRTFNVTIPVGINENIIDKLFIYPNPTNGIINISGTENDIISAEIFDIIGESVFKIVNIENGKINFSLLKDGVYFISIKQSDKIKLFKLIKR